MRAPRNIIGRMDELAHRVANAALLGALHALHRRRNVPVVYRVDRGGVAASFEGAWFRYSPRDFGCTGNIDYVPEAENETREAMFDRLSGGDVFYDIGAHGGIYTITLAKRLPAIVIHSFEPQPEELLANLALNRLPVVNVHAVAVGAEPGEVRMTTGKRSSNHVSEAGEREVPLVRLDDYVREHGIEPPTWIKIDIEGLELPALKGAENLLRQHHPTVVCEINHLHSRFGSTIPDFLGFMRSLGYEIHKLIEGKLHPLREADSTLDYSADWNYWFIHGEKHEHR